MSPKKGGGLTHNPLLTRTDAARAGDATLTQVDTRLPVGTSTGIPVNTPTGPHVDPSAQPAGGTPAPDKADTSTSNKFTFYFTAQELRKLDDVWEIMRRRTRGTKQRFSKSKFVRLALDRLLADFEQDQEQVITQLLVQSED